jgi:hypothetical protein
MTIDPTDIDWSFLNASAPRPPREHPIFRQHEILRVISAFAAPSDQPTLARVSRSFFMATIPWIWSGVIDDENVVSLISGVFRYQNSVYYVSGFEHTEIYTKT